MDNMTEEEQRERAERFRQHLDEAAALVATWPTWLRTILGRPRTGSGSEIEAEAERGALKQGLADEEEAQERLKDLLARTASDLRSALTERDALKRRVAELENRLRTAREFDREDYL